MAHFYQISFINYILSLLPVYCIPLLCKDGSTCGAGMATSRISISHSPPEVMLQQWTEQDSGTNISSVPWLCGTNSPTIPMQLWVQHFIPHHAIMNIHTVHNLAHFWAPVKQKDEHEACRTDCQSVVLSESAWHSSGLSSTQCMTPIIMSSGHQSHLWVCHCGLNYSSDGLWIRHRKKGPGRQ